MPLPSRLEILAVFLFNILNIMIKFVKTAPMKKIYILLFAFIFISIPAQDLEKIAQQITEEGITLYRSEMASWYGTDVFLENYKDQANIGGYFSYIDGGVPKCIFFSKTNKVIGTVAFPTNYNPKDAKLDLAEREFTPTESEYFTLRKITRARIESDTIFKKYNNTNYNIVPIITKKAKKVYILTGTNANNVVLFGNDYLLIFNPSNEITYVHTLHKSLIAQTIVDEKIGKTSSAMHSHVLEAWPYITPTDICTLMLYQKFTDWESYTVVSKEYTSLWNPKSNKLIIMKTDVWKKINEDQKIGSSGKSNP